MIDFEYEQAKDEQHAVDAGEAEGTVYLGGGTNLVDLMRIDVMRPKKVVDVNALPMREIRASAGGVMIGALATNTEVAHHPAIVERFPVLSEAILSGASPQVRNMATVSGNLLQRTRCPYFRDVKSPCNKREPGTGCSAMDGWTRPHAVLGTSDRCIATHPSDMCVALVALDAVVHLRGGKGTRTVPVAELHTLPGQHPEVEHVLNPGELITAVELPARPFATRSRYVKVRDRASFAFALASAAAALDLRGRTIRDARLALGGVATKPWRAIEAEHELVGEPISQQLFERAAAIALRGAKPRGENAFKLELAKRTIVRALMRAGGMP